MKRIVMAAILATGLILPGVAVGANNYWTGPANDSWNTGGNWSGGVPSLTSDVLVTNTTTRTITNGTLDYAQSLFFTNANHTLTSGNLFLGGIGSINVAGTRTATINSLLAGRTGLVKSGGGTLTLGGVNLVTGGISINAGTLTTAATAAGDVALGNNAITLSGTGLLQFRGSRVQYMREFSGTAGTIRGAGHADKVVLNALNDSTYSGAFAENVGGYGTVTTLLKSGPGTQRIESDFGMGNVGSSSFWRGELTFGGAAGRLRAGTSGTSVEMRGGTFTLDNTTANNADRFPDASALKVYAGNSVFRYLGQSGTASSETVGQLFTADYIYGGFLAVDVRPGGSGGTATLIFASQGGKLYHSDRSGGNFANFTTTGTGTLGTDAFVKFTTAPTLTNNVMKRAFANGTDIATYDNTLGVLPFTAYVTPTTDLNSPANTDTVRIDASTTDTQLGANAAWNALKIDGARTIDLNNNTLTIGSTDLASLIVKSGAGDAEIMNTSGTKYLTHLSAAFYVNEGTLKITVPLSSSSYHRVLKAGAGLLWLAPTTNWFGTGNFANYGYGIYFTDGAIRLNPNLGGVGTASRFQNQTMILNGGVMEIEGGITYNPTIGTGSANLMWLSSGGFAAYGSDASFSPSIVWNAANQLPDGAALLLNSTTADKKITLSGTLNIGNDATKMYLREIEVADNPNSVTDLAEISGQIISETNGVPTYTYHLVKTGAGTLSLANNNNTYSGATYVKAGTLAINGTLAAPASTVVANNPEYSAVTVMTGGTLGGTGTIDRVVRVESGGTLAPGNSTGILTLDADASLASGATLAIQINGLTEGTQYDQLKLTDGTLVVSNSTLSLAIASFAKDPGTNYFWIVNNAGSGNTLGEFAGMADNTQVASANGYQWFITYDAQYGTTALDGGNDVLLYMIPEPSALTLVCLGLFGAWALSRRRHRA